jgi:hypothetical protein
MKNTKTDNYFFENIANLKSLDNTIKRINENDDFLSALIFIGDDNNFTAEEINNALKQARKPIVGGVFTGLLDKGVKYSQGILSLGLPYALDTKVIDLSDKVKIHAGVRDFYETTDCKDKSMVVFVDAFADNKITFIEQLYNHFGISVSYVGGGAGSLSFKRKPVVFNEHGIFENSAVLGMMDKNIQVGVSHGWTPISHPLKVTETDGNIVKSIDWEPALDVYQKLIKEHSGLIPNKENFFDVAKSYPFGISKIQSNFVVRDPISIHESGLLIVDEIPQGEFIYVLHADKEKLLKGAADARDRGVSNRESAVFCIDCISRVLYLGDDFGEEIYTIDKTKNIFGIFSLGEIANFGTNLEIFNKTVVVTQF